MLSLTAAPALLPPLHVLQLWGTSCSWLSKSASCSTIPDRSGPVQPKQTERREMNPYMDINITSLVTQAKKENSLNTSQLSSDLLEHRNSPLGKEGYGAGGVWRKWSSLPLMTKKMEWGHKSPLPIDPRYRAGSHPLGPRVRAGLTISGSTRQQSQLQP